MGYISKKVAAYGQFVLVFILVTNWVNLLIAMIWGKFKIVILFFLTENQGQIEMRHLNYIH